MVLAENGASVQVQPSSNAQLLGNQNVDSALLPEITETVLEAADDGCTSAQAFRCMVYDGITIKLIDFYFYFYGDTKWAWPYCGPYSALYFGRSLRAGCKVK